MSEVEITRNNTRTIQRRTLFLLGLVQVIGGVGFAIGGSVGALLAAEMAGVGMSGLAQSAVVVGAALFAIPMTALVRRRGRRPSLAMGYGAAAAGAVVVVGAARLDSIPALFAGFFLFGGATAAGMQARFAAIDLAPVALRARQLSIVVWATTVGAVIGPNLAPLAGRALESSAVPVLAAPFVFSAFLLAFAAVALLALLRPDPMVIARKLRGDGGIPRESEAGAARAAHDAGMRAALRYVLARPSARLGVTAMAVGHLVMIAVMAMTPVHIRAAGHDAAHTLRIVGIVLSLHIAGMYALAPLTGWLTDRMGRLPVIFAGIALLLAACTIAAMAGHDSSRLAIALMVLGMGWSCTMVAGSTLLTDAVTEEVRASAQGLSDVIMGLAGATSGALSGAVVFLWGYPLLAALAALATLPLITQAIGLRLRTRAAAAAPGTM
jgi:MFS family permease